MIAIVSFLFVTGLILYLGLKKGSPLAHGGKHAKQKCPNCGSPVTIRGTHWECIYCGNSGVL